MTKGVISLCLAGLMLLGSANSMYAEPPRAVFRASIDLHIGDFKSYPAEYKKSKTEKPAVFVLYRENTDQSPRINQYESKVFKDISKAFADTLKINPDYKNHINFYKVPCKDGRPGLLPQIKYGIENKNGIDILVTQHWMYNPNSIDRYGEDTKVRGIQHNLKQLIKEYNHKYPKNEIFVDKF